MLRLRRVALGKSQEAVALDSGILNQTTVSELEGGRYELANLTAARLAGLAKGLNWTLAELEAATGIDLGLASYEEKRTTIQRRTPLELSPALEKMIVDRRSIAPELDEYRWRSYLSRMRFRGPKPENPDQWWDIYRDLVRHGIEPEDDQ